MSLPPPQPKFLDPPLVLFHLFSSEPYNTSHKNCQIPYIHILSVRNKFHVFTIIVLMVNLGVC